ncbi:hypothetical protein IL54_3990 [Sphingobium sp. ba1]|nr:hypothetical protein IL54_3990 [Sphingobium sp. ba1]
MPFCQGICAKRADKESGSACSKSNIAKPQAQGKGDGGGRLTSHFSRTFRHILASGRSYRKADRTRLADHGKRPAPPRDGPFQCVKRKRTRTGLSRPADPTGQGSQPLFVIVIRFGSGH